MTLAADAPSSLHHVARSLYTVILRLPLHCGFWLQLLTMESLPNVLASAGAATSSASIQCITSLE